MSSTILSIGKHGTEGSYTGQVFRVSYSRHGELLCALTPCAPLQVEKAAFKAVRPSCTRKVVCQAEKQNSVKQVGALLCNLSF